MSKNVIHPILAFTSITAYDYTVYSTGTRSWLAILRFTQTAYDWCYYDNNSINFSDLYIRLLHPNGHVDVPYFSWYWLVLTVCLLDNHFYVIGVGRSYNGKRSEKSKAL